MHGLHLLQDIEQSFHKRQSGSSRL